MSCESSMFVKENPDKKISLDFYMEQLGFVGNGTETMSRLYAFGLYPRTHI